MRRFKMANIQVLTFAMFFVASCINVGSAMVKHPVYPGSKPGTCPGGMSHCAIEPNQCFKDEDCPGARKCCRWPCGGFNYCAEPSQSTDDLQNSLK
ncbi:uncharacterized protein LOC141914436 [Tubulanus polymorphus]|uniref:uncharacterized protein LOC141914436 n=1 Tax=Tubulanus polymorphus TaxID=672921 RepID=UPI003DA4F750